MNNYNNLPKVSDFDSLMDQLYKLNHSTYDSGLTYSPTHHRYNEELFLPGYNIDEDENIC